MAYVELERRLSDEQIQTIRALASRLDLQPGGGGSRITPFGTLQPDCAAALGPLADGLLLAQAVVLYPSQQIVAHQDPPIQGRRFHVPLSVNEGCWVFHDGTWQQLEEGRCYEMDPTEWHGAVNWGASVRLHLILDRIC